MNKLLENKSKILKLTKEQNRLKSWSKKGDWVLFANAFISLIPFAIFTSINLGLSLTIASVVYALMSIAGLCINLKLKDKRIERIHQIDQDILELVKTDDEEYEILKQYHVVKDAKKNVDVQRDLLKIMIETKLKRSRLIKNMTLATNLKKENKKSEMLEESSEVEVGNE